MATFQEIVNEFDNMRTPRENDQKGKRWEVLCKWYFRNSSIQKNNVKNVWKFEDWPDKPEGDEIGTDLIVQTKDDKIIGVQCKTYTGTIPKDKIASWLYDTSDDAIYDERILMSTGTSLSKNAITLINRGKNKNARFMLFDNFDIENLNWPLFNEDLALFKEQKSKPPPKREHQKVAVNTIIKRFKHVDKGKLIMACGSGKTLTAYWIDEKLKTRLTVCLFPSLLLLSDNIHEWNKYGNFKSLAVCSDSTVSNEKDEYGDIARKLSIDTTTNIEKIIKFISSPGKKVLFGTYDSSIKISEALIQSKKNIDFLIADEAHRTAGVNSAYSICLDDKKFKAKKKLFMTATQRIIPGHIKSRLQEKEVDSLSMDDKDLYGERLFYLSFGEAIEKGLLADYKIHILETKNSVIKKTFTDNDLLKLKNSKYGPSIIASTIAVLKATKKFQFNKFISFHNRVSAADSFHKNFYNISKSLNKKVSNFIFSDVLSAQKSTIVRREKLNKLRNLRSNEFGFISNARCLSEGVDVPSLDGILVSDPRQSKVDIVQMTGRALRKENLKQKKIARIVIPIIVDDSKTDLEQIDESNFKTVNEVISAMRSHDERLDQLINQFVLNSDSKSKLTDLEEKIVFENVGTFSDVAYKEFLLKSIKSREDDWDVRLSDWINFVKEHNRYPREKRSKEVTSTEEISLEKWGSHQRENKETMSKRRREKLNNLEKKGLWFWEKTRRFDEIVMELTTFLNKKHHLVLTRSKHGNLGRSAEKMRMAFGNEPDEYGNRKTKASETKSSFILTKNDIETLQNLHWSWVWDVNEFTWEYYYSLLKFIHENESKHIIGTNKKVPRLYQDTKLKLPKNFKWAPSSTGLISIGRWSSSQSEKIQVTLGKKELSMSDMKRNKKRYISPKKIQSFKKINFDYMKENTEYLILDNKYNNLLIDGKYSGNKLEISWKFNK